MTIDVSFCVTSYNRKNKLENCIKSFLETNLYPLENLEIIVVDNGSDDPATVDFLKGLQLDQVGSFKKIVNKKNDYPFCLRRAKNQARSVASGKYFIDCPDDHIFVVKCDWIKDTIEYLEREKEKISCVCHYAYPQYRFYKPNNLMAPSQVDTNFYVSQLKGYADYHLMKKDVYEDIGKYDETLSFSPNSEADYMDRCYESGYKRSLRRHPVSIIVDDNFFGKDRYAVLKRPLSEDQLKTLDNKKHPTSCESLLRFCMVNNCLEVKSE